VKITRNQLRRIIIQEAKSTPMYDDDPALVGGQSNLPDGLQKAIIKKSKKKEGYRDIDEGHPSQYDAPEGSARDKHLDKTTAALKDDDPSNDDAAWAAREREEAKHRKNEAVKVTRDQIKELVRGAIEEELSKKTKATLKKKAEKRGLTPGSVYDEFEKGLAAWGTSGSRKGMSQHQWAHARVNSASPSKSWSVVKKSKAKKKKK